jgi:hypothetical protein
MDKQIKKIIETLELCCEAIKIIHPELNPDEPCIAWDAYESAYCLIDELKKEF